MTKLDITIFIIGFSIGLLGYVMVRLWWMNRQLNEELDALWEYRTFLIGRIQYWEKRCAQLQNQLDRHIRLDGTVPGDEWKNE